MAHHLLDHSPLRCLTYLKEHLDFVYPIVCPDQPACLIDKISICFYNSQPSRHQSLIPVPFRQAIQSAVIPNQLGVTFPSKKV